MRGSTRIRQILIILLDNAIKFTPKGGGVTVLAHLRAEYPGLLLLQIEDSGCGIKPEMTERIFERLFQTAEPASAGRNGLGLGLYICKELVTRQGGQIWAGSAPGGGAVFFITVPIYSLPNLIAPALRSERPPDGPMTLVAAELGSRTGWLSDQLRSEHSHAVRALIQNCLHSDLDLLLPRMGASGAAELFFIVVLTDAVGGEAIAKRIREQLSSSTYLQQAGLTLSTWYQPLDPINKRPDESPQEVLERVAGHIQEQIDAKLASGGPTGG